MCSWAQPLKYDGRGAVLKESADPLSSATAAAAGPKKKKTVDSWLRYVDSQSPPWVVNIPSHNVLPRIPPQRLNVLHVGQRIEDQMDFEKIYKNGEGLLHSHSYMFIKLQNALIVRECIFAPTPQCDCFTCTSLSLSLSLVCPFIQYFFVSQSSLITLLLFTFW